MGALVIVAGLYMVLWGKSKDQPPSDGSDKVASAEGDHPQALPVSTPGNVEVTSHATVEATRVKPTDEAV